MSEPQRSEIGQNRALVLAMVSIALLVGGVFLPAVNIYSGDSYVTSLRYWDCWSILAYLLAATAAIVLYWCGARRFNLLWYPALATVALVAGPLVKTTFDAFDNHAWAKYLQTAEPGMRWPGLYPAWPAWLALIVGTGCLSTAAWIARPPRWQQVFAVTGAGLLAAGSYLPMQLARSHVVNFWHFPIGLILVAMPLFGLIIAAIGKYRLLWIVVVGSVVSTLFPIIEVSGQIERNRARLEQWQSQILADRVSHEEQFARNNPGTVFSAKEKTDRQQKLDQETKLEMASAAAQMEKSSPGSLYPLGIVVVAAGIVILGIAATMGRPAQAKHPVLDE